MQYRVNRRTGDKISEIGMELPMLSKQRKMKQYGR